MLCDPPQQSSCQGLARPARRPVTKPVKVVFRVIARQEHWLFVTCSWCMPSTKCETGRQISPAVDRSFIHNAVEHCLWLEIYVFYTFFNTSDYVQIWIIQGLFAR